FLSLRGPRWGTRSPGCPPEARGWSALARPVAVGRLTHADAGVHQVGVLPVVPLARVVVGAPLDQDDVPGRVRVDLAPVALGGALHPVPHDDVLAHVDVEHPALGELFTQVLDRLV